ncbi:MAG: 3-phosphoshikimate 1-carboxyvinyltransferase [Fibrobacterota bacterium]|nr:3-phosphoshikimate 1-carboxyvinyltransferase [Fibrobacterota bacterium]QQS06357.1 MAG: 3-phosphoshikimate 1-carboxyvinyltransferase [Fibrobacterota bacterium]
MKRLTLERMPALTGQVRLPGSKSLSNRYLLLAALSRGTTTLVDLLDSDDIRAMKGALNQLGVSLKEQGDRLSVTGIGGAGFQSPTEPLNLGNAGTAMRPLAAALCAAQGEFTLDGVARMRERPIGDLVDGLRPVLADGGSISYLQTEGFPPLKILARGFRGGRTRIKGSTSSQFLTGLLMAAPLSPEPLEIEVEGDLISKPYIEITLRLMQLFGVKVDRDGYRLFSVQPSNYLAPGVVQVEGDASSASYFLGWGALGGKVRVLGCGQNSVQGDAAFSDVLAKMGAQVTKGPDWIECASPLQGRLRGIDIDMIDMPDAAMTLATLALFADGPTAIRGIGSWRVKETERVVAVRDQLRKLGATVDEGPDWIRITPPGRLIENVEIETYDDHRMAMAFSLAAHHVAVTILDPDCTAKTFPTYFQELSRLAGAVD